MLDALPIMSGALIVAVAVGAVLDGDQVERLACPVPDTAHRVDEFNGAGMMPVSLIRWQLTGEPPASIQ